MENLNKPALDAFNATLIEHINEMGPEEIADRIRSVSVYPTGTKIKGESILISLKNYGIAIVHGLIPESWASDLSSIVRKRFGNIDSYGRETLLHENEGVEVLHAGKQRIPTYEAMAKSPKTTILIRSGQDEGMIDVFNIDLMLAPSVSIRKDFERLNFQELLGRPLSNINLYLNKSVLKTRGFHVDCFYPSYKVFIYLTDVMSLDDGPYCYVKDSLGENIFSDFNKVLSESLSANKTEAPLFAFKDLVPVLGKAGTIIISDQSGIHRGYPQRVGRERIALVGRF